MSHELINRSPDLKKLRDEGFEVTIRADHLLVGNVPYVNSDRKVQRGTLVSELTTSGDRTKKPGTHVVHFVGDYPCNKDGSPIEGIRHQSNEKALGDGLVVNHAFSNKPQAGYADYYDKMTTYINIIFGPACSLDASVTAKTFKVIEAENEAYVFNYLDTNSSRAEITHISDKLRAKKIGIVGLGGTGSYILDLVSKTPVEEIHLFDGDMFASHNAFRAPGAASIEELNESPKKTDYLKRIYSKMRKNIYSYPDYVTSSNVEQLMGLDFVFICMNSGDVKRLLIDRLVEHGISFIDVGIGVQIVDDKLIGTIRTTSSTEKRRDHIEKRIPFDEAESDEYSNNIQIADLNALNAAFAVVKWKKLCGFYQDLETENHSTYSLNDNLFLSEDHDS